MTKQHIDQALVIVRMLQENHPSVPLEMHTYILTLAASLDKANAAMHLGETVH